MALVSDTAARAAAEIPRYVGRREGRLRPEAANLYPWIQPGEWQPAAVLADRVLAGRLLSGRGELLWRRPLQESHFEFRGGSARGGERTRG